MAFHILAYLLPRLDDKFYPVSFLIMTSNLHLVQVILPCKITVLAHAEVNTVGTDKARTNYGPHVAAHAFVVVMSRETVCEERKLDAGEFMVLAKYLSLI